MQFQHEHIELLLLQHVELLRMLELQLLEHQLTGTEAPDPRETPPRRPVVALPEAITGEEESRCA